MGGRTWRSKNRKVFLRVSFVLCWVGFYFAYTGGIANNMISIAISFAIFGMAALLAMIIEK